MKRDERNKTDLLWQHDRTVLSDFFHISFWSSLSHEPGQFRLPSWDQISNKYELLKNSGDFQIPLPASSGAALNIGHTLLFVLGFF